MKKILLLALTLIFAATPLVFPLEQAAAVSGGDWQAGRIIDDGIFTDQNAMSPIQIQQFLDSQMPSCDTHGTQTVSYYYNNNPGAPHVSSQSFDGATHVTSTRALYSYRTGTNFATDGTVKPISVPDADDPWYTQHTWFRCLNAYYENPSNEQDNYANRPTPAGGESAAQIIWIAAQNNQINPRVILVTLQKEEALVGDDWPFQSEYNSAMGAYCPDTAACDPAHAGFAAQVNDGAALFRYYLNNMNQPWWTYKKPGNNSVLFSPDGSCGSSNVFIQDTSTAALYTYTPYQPNPAALNNLYGTGDGCSAYGNRNFWRYFNDWFGTTYADGYVAQFAGQSALSGAFYPGESQKVFIRYKNVGSARWYDDTSVPTGISPIHLATSNAVNRSSVFSSDWPSAGRPAVKFSAVYNSDGSTLASSQHSVDPGQIAEFSFNITPPWNIGLGSYSEYFQPVVDGASKWNMGGQAWLTFNVDTRYKAAFSSQGITSSTIQQNNQVVTAYFKYQNVGTAAWYDDTSVPSGYKPTHIATTAPLNRWSGFGTSWPTRSRPAVQLTAVYNSDGTTLSSNSQHFVLPGQIGMYQFQMSAPASIPVGSYREYFQPIMEGSYQPIMGAVSWLDLNVTASSTQAQFYKQSSFPTISRGQSTAAFIQYKNVGNTTWYDDQGVPAGSGFSPVHLAATAPINRQSVFSYGWPSSSRPTLNFSAVYNSDGVTQPSNQHSVAPGQIGQFSFSLTAPWNVDLGTHREYFQPLLENAPNWNIGAVSWIDTTVH